MLDVDVDALGRLVDARVVRVEPADPAFGFADAAMQVARNTECGSPHPHSRRRSVFMVKFAPGDIESRVECPPGGGHRHPARHKLAGMNETLFRHRRYIATDDLMMAVNAAITLGRPLLIKGEPGTGKTQLAQEIARSLDRPLHEWHIKSTSKAQQGLYEYDAVSRLRDSQLGDEKVHDIRNYILKGKLWEAFDSEVQPVLLIDEIDKADIEFPNDLLRELDRMEFYVYETRELVKARHRPVIVITSNNEKELPDAFLRRCFFHYIRFPDEETMDPDRRRPLPGLKRSCCAKR